MTAQNWNLPDNDTDVDDVYAAVRLRDEHIMTQTYTSDTNVPTNTIRWNGTNVAFDRYNGATWAQLFGAAQIDHNLLLNYSAAKHPDRTGTETISGNWTFSGACKFSSDLLFSASGFRLKTDTADGDDHGYGILCGGGGWGSARGAGILAYGNECADAEGDLTVMSGNSTKGRIRFYPAGSLKALFQKSGALELLNVASPSTPSSGDVAIFNAAGLLSFIGDDGEDYALRAPEVSQVSASDLESRTTGSTSWFEYPDSSVTLPNVKANDFIFVTGSLSCGLSAGANSCLAVRPVVGATGGPVSTTAQVGAAGVATTVPFSAYVTGKTGSVAVSVQWATPDGSGSTMYGKYLSMQVLHFRASK